MKYLILLAALLFSTPVLADSTFLSGLNFTLAYEQKGDPQFTKISKEGISVKNFMLKVNDTTTPLGEKVALIEALSSYYEWAESPKGKFKLYQTAFFSQLKMKNVETISVNNESFESEIRLLWVLMNDYDTTSPNVKSYHWLAKEMPHSFTAQSISVMAYAYDILYNDRNDFGTIQDLKKNYLQPYYDHLHRFDLDAPIGIKEVGIDELLPYTLDCENRIKCLVDSSTEKLIIDGLNDLSDEIKSSIDLRIKINANYAANWMDTKDEALSWISIQEKTLNKLKASKLEKAKIRYFFSRKLYELMHNIDYLSSRLYESSLIDELKKSKSKCKIDAMCAATAFVTLNNSSLEQKGIFKKDIDLLVFAKSKYKLATENLSNNLDIASAARGVYDEPRYVFENQYDALYFMMIYFYLNPEKIDQMYELN